MFQVYYMLTNACNLMCTHCIRGNSEKTYTMQRENAILGLDKIADWNPNIMLILTGGEPTIHPNFEEILNFALQRFVKVVINTNGTTNFFQNCNIEQWKKSKNLLVQVSIDGSEKYHDEIRGKGNFIRSINTIRFLKENGIRVAVSTTVNKNNIDSMVNLCDMLSNLKIFKWHVSAEMPIGRAAINECLETEQWNNLVDVLINKARILLGIKKSFNFEKVCQLTEDELLEKGKKCIYSCGIGRYKLYIDSQFNAHPCTCVNEIKCGSLLSNSIEEIMNSSDMKELRRLKVSLESPCYKCKYLPICNGGCVGLSKMVFGEIGYGDIRCETVRRFYNEKIVCHNKIE